jgi:hypothetical protein
MEIERRHYPQQQFRTNEYNGFCVHGFLLSMEKAYKKERTNILRAADKHTSRSFAVRCHCCCGSADNLNHIMAFGQELQGRPIRTSTTAISNERTACVCTHPAGQYSTAVF